MIKWAKIENITPIKKNTKVYNFHVPGNENYFANGILTHNCYIARNRQLGNPLEVYTNIDEIIEQVRVHSSQLPIKQPNQCHTYYWSYDISEGTDLLNPDLIPIANKVIAALVEMPTVMPTFATKACSPTRVAKLVDCPIPYKARIRASLSPQRVADILEVGTAKIVDRLHGLNLAYTKNFECHLNFSPVILYQGWEADYIELFKLVDSILLPEVKQQLKLEVIFATHNKRLHELNLEWRPQAEKLLWVPSIQETKVNNRGSTVIRYKWQLKQKAIAKFRELVKQWLPFAEIRYIF